MFYFKKPTMFKRRAFLLSLTKKIGILSVGNALIGTNPAYGQDSHTGTQDVNKTDNQNSLINSNVGLDSKELIALLRQPDGYKYIGECQSIEELKKIEPIFSGQKIILSSITNKVDNLKKLNRSNTGNYELWFDSDDKSTPNDDILCFVTTQGNRWKRVNTGLIEFDWCDNGEEDKSLPLQKAINFVYSLAIKSGKTYDLPIINIKAGTYNMLSSVEIFPFIQLKSQGSVTFDFRKASNISFGFSIRTEESLKQDFLKMPGNTAPCLNGINGTITIVGSGRKDSKAAAISIGNQSKSQTPCRDVKTNNIVISGWRIAHLYQNFDTYLIAHRDCRLESNKYNLVVSGQNENSGEKISYDGCTIAGSGLSNIYINAPGFDFNFINCSFDFSGKDIFFFGNRSGYQCIRIIACHLEQWDGYIINCANKSNNISVMISNVILLPRANDSSILNSPSRALFKLKNGVTVSLVDFEIRHEYPAVNDKISMTYDDNGQFICKNYVKDPFPQIPSESCNFFKDINLDKDFKNSLLDKNNNSNWKIELSGTDAEIKSDGTRNTLLLKNDNKIRADEKLENFYNMQYDAFIPIVPNITLNLWCCLRVIDTHDVPKITIILQCYDSDKKNQNFSEIYVFDYKEYFGNTKYSKYFVNNTSIIASNVGRRVMRPNTNFVKYSIKIENIKSKVEVSELGLAFF